MDVFKMMQTGEGIEQLEQNLLDLDSEFRFKCRRCGKCCINQDTILLNTRDTFNIAKKKGMTMQQVVDAYTEVYIGPNSQIPVVHLLSNGPKGACPLLENGRCGVHDCKPTVCALFPLGRLVIAGEDELTHEAKHLQTKYILNDYNCGSAGKVNTVRSWLAKFGIPEQDEYFMLWNKVRISLVELISRLKEAKVSKACLDLFWGTVYQALYIQYDTRLEFMPQFQAAADKLIYLSKGVMNIPLPPKQEV